MGAPLKLDDVQDGDLLPGQGSEGVEDQVEAVEGPQDEDRLGEPSDEGRRGALASSSMGYPKKARGLGGFLTPGAPLGPFT